MATKTLITEAEYLGMSFDGPEPDYVDGELVERSMPTTNHGNVQLTFGVLIHPWRKGNRLFAVSEVRIATAPGHYRVGDIFVFRDRLPEDPMPLTAPFIAVEIISPSDRHEELMIKLAEYRELGVPHIWIIDPGLRSLSVFEGRNLIAVDAFELPEYGLRFTPEQLFES